MKFHQLPDGCRFEFDGEFYTKSGTLKACHEQSGHLRVIRRSATVKILERGESASGPGEGPTIGTGVVRAAFEKFWAICDDCLKEAAAGSHADSLSATKAKLDAAREEFLAFLK